MVIFPRSHASWSLCPVQVYKVGSVTSGFICLLEVLLGTELILSHAKHVGDTPSMLLPGIKEHLSFCRRECG